MAERELLVRIVGDDRDLQRALGNTQRSVDRLDRRTETFGRNIGRAFAAVGISVGTAAIFAGLEKSISAASDLNEQVSKSRQIFGDSSREIEAWAQTTAQAFGVSERAALTATGTFGNLFRVVDVAPEQASEMSRALVQLAADLASFNNASPEDVLTALRSGLIGEAEPLRRYGVLLSETRVQQQAMADTGKDNVRELTNQEKALARYNIILQDTAPAQGDFARTSESLANQQRTLQANFEDLSAHMGAILIPVLTDAAEAANLLFEALDKMRGVDFSPGFDFPEPPSWLRGLALAPISPLGAVALTTKRGIERFTQPEEQADPTGPQRSRGRAAARRAEKQANDLERDALEADRARRRAQRAYDALLKGLGLKLDKAGLTASLNDDLDALRELERAIRRRIEQEGRTFALVSALTSVQLQIAATAERRAGETKEANERAARAVKEAADAKEQLEREMREAARVRGIGRQFEALGLTAEGDVRAPGAGALRQRARSLEEQIKGTALDTSRTRQTLDRIQNVLTGKFGEVGRNVRQSILGMLNDITSALEGDQGTKQTITKFQKRGVEQLIEGLGLTEEQVKELRQRFAGMGAGGTAPRRGTGAFGFDITSGAGGFPRPVGESGVVEVHVFLDGKEISVNTTRHQQKQHGRAGRSRRGTRVAGGV